MKREKLTLEKIRNIVNDEPIMGQYSTYITKDEKSEAFDKLKEGEIWIDKEDKKWTMKNGVIVSIPKVKPEGHMPFSCPVCGESMKINKWNKACWSRFNKCFDCVMRDETDMKIDGTWKEYEKEVVERNLIAYLKDKRAELVELKNSVKERVQIPDSEGILENWDVPKETVKTVRKNIDQQIDQVDKLIEMVKNGSMENENE